VGGRGCLSTPVQRNSGGAAAGVWPHPMYAFSQVLYNTIAAVQTQLTLQHAPCYLVCVLAAAGVPQGPGLCPRLQGGMQQVAHPGECVGGGSGREVERWSAEHARACFSRPSSALPTLLNRNQRHTYITCYASPPQRTTACTPHPLPPTSTPHPLLITQEDTTPSSNVRPPPPPCVTLARCACCWGRSLSVLSSVRQACVSPSHPTLSSPVQCAAATWRHSGGTQVFSENNS
jgi:hypothetical protein